MLHEGRILIVASPQGILSSSDPVVQQFISGSIEGPIQYR
jgi:ABC-type transporter Mla maintaining outer membrane lipid asymmetry ATPase subunit MlaF